MKDPHDCMTGDIFAIDDKPLVEADIEAYLVKRVKRLGGEVRKVQWIGRKSAPDRLVLLPTQTFWAELKRPGLAAGFPADAHERAQHREHNRLREFGHTVYVLDSYDMIDGVLK